MTEMQETPAFKPMAERFRGFLPVVVDVETGGFDWNKHALLEIAAVPIELDEHGRFVPGEVAQVLAHLGGAGGAVEADHVDAERLERGQRHGPGQRADRGSGGDRGGDGLARGA